MKRLYVTVLCSLMATVEMMGQEVIAHRGASSVAPENTIASIEAAIAAEADLVEFDVRSTADGILVLFHDHKLERTTGEKGELGAQKWDDLKSYEVGRWFSEDFAGERIPLLSEVIELLKGKRASALIERKSGSAEQFAEALLPYAPEYEGLFVQSFDAQFLKELHERAPEIKLGYLGEGKLGAFQLDAIRESGVRFIGWKAKDLSKGAIALAIESGLQVYAWTVNEESDAVRLVEWGVDGIITDRPAEVRKAIDLATQTGE